jgi:hypothetical protein
MSPERPELRLIRESLEAVVTPSIASTVVFEALEASGGRLPEGPAAARAFTDGPLRAALRRRLGPDADPIVDEVVQTLAALAPAPSPPPPPRSSSHRELDDTREIVLDDRPVVVVVASSDELTSRLRAALGAARIAAVPIRATETLLERVRATVPQVVLIDGADFAPIEPDALAAALEHLPARTVRAIWGVDLPYGALVLRALVDRGAPATPLDRREGIEVVLDLIRARRSSK